MLSQLLDSYRALKYLLLSLFHLHHVYTNPYNAGFKGVSGCTNGWISPKCSFTSSVKTKSVIECITLCARTPGCYSVNACKRGEGSFTCDIIGDMVTGCGDLTSSDNCRYLQHNDVAALLAVNPCKNGGTWDNSDCHCVWGFAGDRCERLVRSCKEAYQLGVRGMGFYKIQPFGSPVAYTVYCDCKWAKGIIYALKRIVPPPSYCPPINYNRTWEEYKNGFGNIDCEYFVGLETLYQLTIYSKYQWDFYNLIDDPIKVTVNHMEDTVLKSEAQNYDINFIRVFNAPGKVGDDAFDNSEKPRPFCTWDRDCGGCARTVGGGWWFTSSCTGGALTAPQSQMVWPVSGVDKVIEVAYLQMDHHGYR